MDNIHERLERVEDKLDTIVRLEERQSANDEALKRAVALVDLLQDRVRTLEIKHSRHDEKASHNGNIIWAIVSMGLTILSGIIVYNVKSL